MGLKETLGLIGEKISEGSAFLIRKLSEAGLNVTNLQAKIISLIVIVGAVFVMIKFLTSMNKMVKFVLILLLVVLAVLIILSFI